jgi:hypothetical protein
MYMFFLLKLHGKMAMHQQIQSTNGRNRAEERDHRETGYLLGLEEAEVEIGGAAKQQWMDVLPAAGASQNVLSVALHHNHKRDASTTEHTAVAASAATGRDATADDAVDFLD